VSAAESAVTRRIKLSAHISCDLTVGPGDAVCEWVGGRPHHLTAAQQRRYRSERDRLLTEVARKLGGRTPYPSEAVRTQFESFGP
jgi:hypothetical protein